MSKDKPVIGHAQPYYTTAPPQDSEQKEIFITNDVPSLLKHVETSPSLDNELRELAEDIRIELIGGEWTDIGGYRHTYEVGGQHIKAIVKLMSPLIQKAREETTQQLELKQAEVNFWKDRIELEKNKVKLLQRTREEAEIDGELRAHERYDIVPVKQLRSHMAARKNILELKKAKGEKR